MCQRMELSKNCEIAEKTGMIATMGRYARAPLTGYLVQEASQGVCWGAWVRNPRPDHASPASAGLGPAVTRIAAGFIAGARIHIAINGEPAGVYPIGGGGFACRVRSSRHLRDTFSVSIDFDAAERGAPPANDPRDMALLLTELRAHHPCVRGLSSVLRLSRDGRPRTRVRGFRSGTGAGLRQRFFHRDQAATGRFHLLESDAIPIQHRGHPFGRDGDAHFGHRAADDLDYLRCR